MSQTGYTPILIYSSSTASNAPAAGNLTNSTLGSELAINITDGKLFYKDNANAVQVIGWKTTPTSAGGTGLTSYTAGDLLYYASGTALSKLTIGSANYVLTSSGTAPQWTAQSGLSVGTALNHLSNATTGVMQIVGPAAGTTRVMTIPDANYTVARTDAGQTFTGTQTFSSDASINGLTIGKGASSVASNSALGVSSLRAITTGNLNTAAGYQTGYSVQGGAENAFFGANAGYSITSSSGNTIIGAGAGYTNQTGNNQTAVGNGALYYATGNNNTAVGASAGANMTTGTNNTTIGYQAGNSASVINLTTQSNRVVVGDANITNAYILVAWTVTSDARDKTDVVDAPYGLNFVNDLRPVIYKWDKRSKYENQIPDGTHKESKTQLGFLAQEVVALEKKYGGVDKDLLIADDEIDESLKITETKMIPVLVKAIQELNQKFETYIKEHP